MSFTAKQQYVIDCVKKENPKILLLHGAVRSGKTFIGGITFLNNVQMNGGKGLSYILAGATQSNIRRNLLDDWEVLFSRRITLSKSNSFTLFGNKIYCFGGGNADDWKNLRGFEAAGAYLNEATALHDTFIKETMTRCSYPGARIIMDTNPDNPAHPVKTDYIDKDGQLLENGNVNIRAIHFTLWDNTKLDSEFTDGLVQATPSGMFTDRLIKGMWVAPDGIIYSDFAEDLYITSEQISEMKFTKYFAGVDWGYEHYGVVGLFGVCGEKVVLLEEYAERHKEIEYWLDIAKSIKKMHGNVLFYCDSARPEHVEKFKRHGINAVNADKSVIAGIEQVARRFKSKTLLIHHTVKRFRQEIMMYQWNKTTGEPIKLFDDCLDMIRYGIYSHFAEGGKIQISNLRL